ncbi:enoyl-CoA hydratase/isomerase family protein [Natrinema hispanicum]|uniref:Enoyl-CoA hydratase/carnithine racemase n=1 Tax=Natrinema hispanicum TaxID=392421 RepID=A0A1I0IG02_9EURY|nr:enoyl-CoA hydratase-related protein [Natrinema hispanicum]SET94989.1 Enoyl-CoA hydratase/carnithine racemase [Natrinema hispanicum]
MRIDDGSIRQITFDRPDVYNAMTAAVAHDLADALIDLDSSDHDAVVITGDGDAFSAGGDIEAMAERDESAPEAYERVRTTLGRVAEAVLTAPVPVVAKVNGDAVGAGMALTAVADFAYAAESARFGASFINVGLVPDLGGTAILPRLIGLRKTKELAFTGKLLSATEAADLDIVNEAVPDDQLDDRVDNLLETLAEQPTESICLAKRAIHGNLGASLQEGLEREAHFQTLAYDTDAHAEGVDAFLNDRTPEF